MTLKWMIMAILLVATGFCPAYAENLAGASLRDLIVLGLENNLGLEIERQNIMQSRETVTIEEAVFDSRIFAGTSYDHSRTPVEPTSGDDLALSAKEYEARIGIEKKLKNGMTASATLDTSHSRDNDFSSDLNPRTRTSFTIELTQPLLRHFSIDVNTAQARIAANQSRQTALSYLLEAQNLTLLFETVVRQLAGEARIVGLREDAVALAEELFRANQKRFDAGLIPVSEVQEAETSLADKQLSLSQEREQFDLHREELSRQLHIRLDRSFDPVAIVATQDSAAVFAPDTERLFSEARLKRLEFKINELALDTTELNTRYQRNLGKPQLDLTARAGINGLSGDDRGIVDGQHYGNGWADSYSSLAERDGYQWGVGLDFSWPLGNRAAKARLRQAEQQHRQQTYRGRDLEVQVRDELERQGITLVRSLEQLRLAERFSELARTSLNQEQRRLDEGLSDTFRMISFQDKMIDARIRRINATTRYKTALATMAFLTGTIFDRHGIRLTENAEEIDFDRL